MNRTEELAKAIEVFNTLFPDGVVTCEKAHAYKGPPRILFEYFIKLESHYASSTAALAYNRACKDASDGAFTTESGAQAYKAYSADLQSYAFDQHDVLSATPEFTEAYVKEARQRYTEAIATDEGARYHRRMMDEFVYYYNQGETK